MSNLEISRAQRLDQKVVELLPEISRAFAGKLIEGGKVTLNGEVITKPGQKLKPTDDVIVDYKMQELDAIPDIELPILYEDDDCVVLNKPVGVLTHSKGAFNHEATVATFLRRHTKDLPGERGGIVHRLDRATSGVIICAKHPAALAWLQKQFSQRKAKKTYTAIVSGQLPNEQAIIDMPIERNPKKPQTFRVGANGKPAVTAYTVMQVNEKLSELELKPTTGRTHQLRVHLSRLGHPIVGDILYGGVPADRLYLHAMSLEITLPSRERKTFEAPIPPAFAAIMEG